MSTESDGKDSQASQEHKDEEKPRVGILYCGGAMSSAGELTAIASFEVLKRLGPQEVGMGCVSALAAGIPKHFKTMQGIEKVLVIDGCPNSCARKVVEKAGSKMDAYLNLGKDLGIKKIGPFKPMEFSPEDFEKAVQAIMDKVRENGESK